MSERNLLIEDMRLAMRIPQNRIDSATRAIFRNDLKGAMECVDGISVTAEEICAAVRFMRQHVPGTVINRYSK